MLDRGSRPCAALLRMGRSRMRSIYPIGLRSRAGTLSSMGPSAGDDEPRQAAIGLHARQVVQCSPGAEGIRFGHGAETPSKTFPALPPDAGVGAHLAGES